MQRFKKNLFFIFKFFIFQYFLLFNQTCYAVPLSFMQNNGTNMRDTEWKSIESSNFIVYYPKESINIAKYAIISLEKSYPSLSYLLGVQLDNKNLINLHKKKERVITSSSKKIPFIIGNNSDGAGFANPVTLNIEAQILHSRPAAFFQHELVHRLMYEHNDFSIGPIGRLFSLAMMPVWWIEGLAEYLSNSVGENSAKNVLKEMALSNYWPTWERLHSLYQADNDTNLRGYVTSGYFLGWILEHLENPDLYKIHKEIFSKTVTPPFYNALDAWLYENFAKTGAELYAQFKAEKSSEWQDKIKEIPRLFTPPEFNSERGQEFAYPIVNANSYTFYSKLTSSEGIYSSSLHYKYKQEEKRLPVTFQGSSTIAIGNLNYLELVTSNLQRYSNGKSGHEIIVIRSKGNILQLSEENYTKQIIEFSTANNPIFIDEIYHLNQQQYIISTANNGNSELYIFDTQTNKIQLISSYQFPKKVKVLSNPSKTNCFYYILDSDENLTSLHKICLNNFIIKEQKELIKNKQFNIKDAYVRNNNSIILNIYYKDLSAIIEYKINENNLVPYFIYHEWIETITAAAENPENEMTFWYYQKGKYFLAQVELEQAKENYQNKNLSKLFSLAEKNAFYQEYQAPYEQILKNNNLLLSTTDFFQIQNNKDNAAALETLPPEINAPYNPDFLFAYPYALPDFLGGPSLGLFAIPLIDTVERFRIIFYGGYHFYLNAPAGSISYFNNRIFDEFSIKLFSNPFFNGYYTIQENETNQRYYNYLQQTGIALNSTWQFNFLHARLTSQFSLYRLEPYSHLKSAPPEIGTQKSTLFSLGLNLQTNLLNTAFYLGNPESVAGKWLKYSIDSSLSASKYNGIGNAQNVQETNTGILDFYKLSTTLTNTFHFSKTKLFVIGKVSTTQGNNTLNIKEIYSPFETYILGSNSALNYLSYPIIQDGDSFELQAGSWSYSGSMSYHFPLYPDFETKFLFSYVNNLRGILSISRGGVADDINFRNVSGITSASVGSSIDLDIKGFQLFPSILYSWIISKQRNWSILFQLNFMNFL